MDGMSAWSRLLRVVAANEAVLPFLRPCLRQLRSLIAEQPEEALRDLRRRRALRSRGGSPSRTLRSARRSRPVRRAG